MIIQSENGVSERHMYNEKMYLELASPTAVFSAAPHQTRMASCFRDRLGRYHLFADFMESGIDSWDAEIRYWTSENLRDWEYVGIAVPRGVRAAPDSLGAASPHVVALQNRILLFYAGRASPAGGKTAQLTAKPGEPGYVSGSIMLSTAPANAAGAPDGEFCKQGVLFERGSGWDAMRHDDPCAVIDGHGIHLYFKGFDTNRDLNRVQAGCASAALKDLKFTKNPCPVLGAPGGGEMPRVFKQEGRWRMLYRHFHDAWCEYDSADGLNWNLKQRGVFVGHTPNSGPCDIMFISEIGGNTDLVPEILAAGYENGFTRLWHYRLHVA